MHGQLGKLVLDHDQPDYERDDEVWEENHAKWVDEKSEKEGSTLNMQRDRERIENFDKTCVWRIKQKANEDKLSAPISIFFSYMRNSELILIKIMKTVKKLKKQ